MCITFFCVSYLYKTIYIDISTSSLRVGTLGKFSEFHFSDPCADPRFCMFSARITQKYPKNEDLDENPHEDLIFLKILVILLYNSVFLDAQFSQDVHTYSNVRQRDRRKKST